MKVETELLKHDQALLVAELEQAGALIRDPMKSFLCPFHGDKKTPSAHIRNTPGGWRFHCFGCGVDGDVIDIMARRRGIGVADVLRDMAEGRDSCPVAALSPVELIRNTAQQGNGSKGREIIHGWTPPAAAVACYFYNRVDGSPHYRKLRFQKPDGGKFFQFERFDRARDSWIGGDGCMEGVERVLYRNEQLAGFQRVFIAEGEKCCDCLWDIGLLAVCNDDGAGEGKWKPEFSAALAGKDVVILPDCDEVGRAHGIAVAESLVGIAKTVRLVELPGLGEKQDVYDFLNGGTL